MSKHLPITFLPPHALSSNSIYSVECGDGCYLRFTRRRCSSSHKKITREKSPISKWFSLNDKLSFHQKIRQMRIIRPNRITSWQWWIGQRKHRKRIIRQFQPTQKWHDRLRVHTATTTTHTPVVSDTNLLTNNKNTILWSAASRLSTWNRSFHRLSRKLQSTSANWVSRSGSRTSSRMSVSGHVKLQSCWRCFWLRFMTLFSSHRATNDNRN